jgi:hypothetical protein
MCGNIKYKEKKPTIKANKVKAFLNEAENK